MPKNCIKTSKNLAFGKNTHFFPPQLPAIQACFVKQQQTLSVAESCTGGLLSYLLTQLPGASQFFLGGVISYSNQVKSQILQISSHLLKTKGAVNAEICRLMAQGVKKLYKTHWAMAITGVAGPSKSALDPPVGTVFVALVGKNYDKLRHIRCSKKKKTRNSKRICTFCFRFFIFWYQIGFYKF